ncbi:MAG: serine/threonine protein kinase [Anaerolineales bacterium]|nr:serine/threonine protein kinase [Anaerolineales bacterium]
MELTNIGRYEIKKELGRGGMATVYHAFDTSFNREVAIKILPREFLHNPQFLDRFQREVKTIAQLEHPAIVPVYDVGEHDGIPYFVMRYMPGGSLSDMIKKGRFSPEDTARIVERLASALSYAHRKGVIHRDLKPDNILFNEDAYPFISDFGIAKISESQTNLTGSGIIGTPAYMSPEQATGDALDHRSDVYGLGVIVYQMLTGQQPYNADTPMGVAIKHVTDPVPDIRLIASDLSEELADVMKKVLAKNRDERYSSAVEFARALNQVVFGSPGAIQESSPTIRLIEKEKESPAKNKMLYIAGGIVVGMLLLGALIFGGIKLFGSQNAVVPTATQQIVPVTEALATNTVADAFLPMCKPPQKPPIESMINETNRACTRGVPYTTYEIPKGATFETLNSEFKCSVVGSKGDKDLIACTGKPLFTFDLKVCIPQVAPALVMDSGKCPANAGLNEADQCCAPAPKDDAGCIIFQAETTGCN